jgi:hypothetical protein
MRRFFRLTPAHSKKIDKFVAMVALYTTWYDFARVNSAVACSRPWPQGSPKPFGTSAIT